MPSPSPLRCSAQTLSLLKRLHEQSSAQEAAIPAEESKPIHERFKTDPVAAKQALDNLMLDKFIALDEDKALFIYSLLLSSSATTVIEVGTSFGVSTIYWALAVGENMTRFAGQRKGVVIGTEKETSKAAVARQYWAEAGPEVEKWIQLEVGDLNEMLATDLRLDHEQEVDAVILDSESAALH